MVKKKVLRLDEYYSKYINVNQINSMPTQNCKYILKTNTSISSNSIYILIYRHPKRHINTFNNECIDIPT